MIIQIIVVGKIKNNFIKEGVEEYIKRIKPYSEIEIINVPNFTNFPPPYALLREEEFIKKFIKDSSFYIALDTKGIFLTSEDLANKVKEFLEISKNFKLSFIIGGIFGLSENIKKNAKLIISLSPLTFTHEFALLILLEQIYRSFKIIRNEPYHY
ncbi:MAG: 23S rRNA (pseudouridine(1915)-N(3))-methyltransferase RlmH [Dictyoglomaceae bacterium]